jgi:hypothetical protein
MSIEGRAAQGLPPACIERVEPRFRVACRTSPMKQSLAFLLVVFALATGSMRVSAEPTPPRFTDPAGPDRAEIEFRTSGCFGGSSVSMVIFRDRPYVSVTDADGRAWLDLSAEDLAGLDRLFDFYRSNPRGGCTTTDEVAIRWFRGETKIASEHLTDSSCLTDYHDLSSFPDEIRERVRLSPEDREAIAGITLTLHDLVRRARKD